VTPLIEDDNSDVTDRFDIVGKPNATRTVKISIGNFSINKLRLRIVPTNATTSMDGKIVYTDKVRAGQYGLKYAFADMTKPQTLILAPNKTKDVTFKIKLPSDKIEGLVMGGFNVYDVSKDGVKGNANVPVWITGNNKAVGGIISLHNLTLDVISRKPLIIINLQNKEPGQMKNVIVHMTVKRKSWLDRFNLGPKEMIAIRRIIKLRLIQLFRLILIRIRHQFKRVNMLLKVRLGVEKLLGLSIRRIKLRKIRQMISINVVKV
jgi:Bacterial protein of unknown function (DUF916).